MNNTNYPRCLQADVKGLVYDMRVKLYQPIPFREIPLHIQITEDNRGVTLSVTDGKFQFTVPAEKIRDFFRNGKQA